MQSVKKDGDFKKKKKKKKRMKAWKKLLVKIDSVLVGKMGVDFLKKKKMLQAQIEMRNEC